MSALILRPQTNRLYEGQFDPQYPDHYVDPQLQLSRAADDPRYLNNLVLESGYMATSVDLEFLRDSRQVAQTMQTYGALLLMEFELDTMDVFRRIAENGNETIDFNQGHQLTPEDEAQIIAENRKPYEFSGNFTSITRAVLGEAIAMRTDWQAVAANARSEPKAEIANKTLRWIAQRNKINRVKAGWLRDGLMYGVGFVGVSQDPLDPFGAVKLERVRPQECRWDINSCVNNIHEDTKYFWRATWVDRITLAEQIPEWRKEILTLTGDFLATTGWEAPYVQMRPKQKVPVGQQGMTSNYNPTLREMYGRLLFRREFYIRRQVKMMIVCDPFTGEEFRFNPERDPEGPARKQQELELMYMATPIWGALTPYLRATLFTARRASVNVIDQMIFIGNTLVRVNSGMEDGLPYVDFAPNFYNGDVTPYFDYLKAPQRWYNRIMSMIDQMIAGGKDGMVINAKYKPKYLSDEEFRDLPNQPNWKIFVDEFADDFKMEEFIHIVNAGQNPEAMRALLQMVVQNNQETSGGSNQIGIEAFKGQSGRSAEELRQAGSNLTKSAFDVFADSQAALGQRAYYVAQFLHPAAQMRVYDDDKKPEFFSLIQHGVESLMDYEFDVFVSEVVASPSEKNARLNRLMALAGQVPQVAQVITPAIVRNSGLDYSEVKQITTDLANLQQQTSQQAQQEYQLKLEEMRGKMNNEATKTYLNARQQAWIERNAPKLMLTGKVNTANPLLMTEILNWAGEEAGMDAHPAMMIAGEEAANIVRQSAITMMQTEEAANTPDWQRKAIENQVKIKRGAPTAKDAGNRALREVRSGAGQ